LGKIKNKKFCEKVLTKLAKCGIMVISGRSRRQATGSKEKEPIGS
jgi:hypothetical protein